ncbi:hypothetical protein [Bradyrhizobium sp. USDA 10063]
MIYIGDFLSVLFAMQQIMYAGGWHWYIAQQRWLESMNDPEDNVVYVDFKAVRQAKQGA